MYLKLHESQSLPDIRENSILCHNKNGRKNYSDYEVHQLIILSNHSLIELYLQSNFNENHVTQYHINNDD